LGHSFEELKRQCGQHSGAVARIFFAAAGASVDHVTKNLIGIVNDLPRSLALDVRDEADSASVFFVGRVVQTAGFGKAAIDWNHRVERSLDLRISHSWFSPNNRAEANPARPHI